MAAMRNCELCGKDINHMRSDARFCSRKHKSIMSDSKRNYKVEYQINKEVRQAQALKYYYADHRKSKENQLIRQKKRIDKAAAYQANRRASKLLRTPKWLTEDDLWIIKEIYGLAAARTRLHGFAWHVDHIIPLQGKLVSGLHVPSNLQVIEGHINISKHNKFEAL